MISVVITTYGDEGWRELAYTRALASAEDQGAHEVLVHHEPELEIGPARNAAAATATGEWLLFLDADDELSPGYVDAMKAAISRQGGGKWLFQPAVSYVRKGRIGPPQINKVKDLSQDNYLVVGTVVRKHLFEEVGGFSDYPHGFEDWSLWAKCWRAGAQIVPVRKAIYVAHINPHSKHRALWRNRKEQVATHLRVQKELFG